MHTIIQHSLWMSLAACVCFPISSAAQNLVVNGGFDTDASSWTSTNIGSGHGFRPSKGNPGGYFELDASPSLLTDPTVNQVVTGFTPGVGYTITGDYEKLVDWGGGSPTGLSFGVAIDGAYLYEAPQSDWAWHSFGFAFVATTSSVTLSISAQRNGTGVSYGVDNIVAQPTPSVTARVVAPNIVFLWPTNVLGFSLQTSTNFAAGSWSAVTNSAVIVGSNYSVTLSATQKNRFFRLKR
jgi:hypothetical protein